jgi:phosphoserine aminotransferase
VTHDTWHVTRNTCHLILATAAFRHRRVCCSRQLCVCVKTYHSARVWLCGLGWTGPAGLDGQADKGSMLNTPPTWSIYVAGLVFKWVEAQGGIATFEGALRLPLHVPLEHNCVPT